MTRDRELYLLGQCIGGMSNIPLYRKGKTHRVTLVVYLFTRVTCHKKPCVPSVVVTYIT